MGKRNWEGKMGGEAEVRRLKKDELKFFSSD